VVPLNKHKIQIIILDDSTRRVCDADCGEDWSSPEVIALSHQRIIDRFGDNIQLEYIDLSLGTANHHTSEWSQTIKDRNLLVPLLLVNGELRISGQFDIRQLLDVIEAEIEIGAR